jgi:hypothetical protein
MPSAPSWHAWANLGDAFVQQEAGLGIAEQPREHGFAFEKREVAQILPIKLD